MSGRPGRSLWCRRGHLGIVVFRPMWAHAFVHGALGLVGCCLGLGAESSSVGRHVLSAFRV